MLAVAFVVTIEVLVLIGIAVLLDVIYQATGNRGHVLIRAGGMVAAGMVIGNSVVIVLYVIRWATGGP